jgi:hypothetical protein
VVHKFLECGDLESGFARIRCDHCEHEYLLAFSCKSRWFCPSCHQKNVQTTARFILEHVLAAVPHRHYVLAITRMLRPYFQRHRWLLKRLCALAHESLAEYLRTALECPKGVPGIIMTLHTFGEYLDFQPHIHALVADGLFVREALPPEPAATTAPDKPRPACPGFLPLPETPLKPLEEVFRAKVINLLVEQRLLPVERVQVLYSWKHSGFNVHAGEQVPPEAKADLEGLAQYILRNPFSVEKMTLESPGDIVIYRSRLNAKINRNFEVFTPTDFLAAITQHIPDKGAQMVRYYGWYSNKMRGVCRVTFKTRILCAIKTRMLRRSGSGGERWVWLWDQERPAGRRHHRLGADSAGRLNGARRRWPIGEGRAGLCRRPRRGRAFAGSRRKATKGKLELGAGPIVFRPELG